MNEQKLVVALGLCAAVSTFGFRAGAQDASAGGSSTPPSTAPAAPVPAETPGAAEASVEQPSSAGAQSSTPAASPPDAATPPVAPPVVPEPASPAPFLAAPAAVSQKPSSLRIPGFIALGVGGLSASGAAAATLAASAPYNDPKSGCAGRCADASRTLAFTANVLAGVAIVGLGVGLALLVASPKTERASLSPDVRLKLALRKAAATATWRF